MPEDPYSDPVTGILCNEPGLRSSAALDAAEREITHAALILLDESPAWQHLDPVRNVDASAAIMGGDPEPMREMLEAIVRDGT